MNSRLKNIISKVTVIVLLFFIFGLLALATIGQNSSGSELISYGSPEVIEPLEIDTCTTGEERCNKLGYKDIVEECKLGKRWLLKKICEECQECKITSSDPQKADCFNKDSCPDTSSECTCPGGGKEGDKSCVPGTHGKLISVCTKETIKGEEKCRWKTEKCDPGTKCTGDPPDASCKEDDGSTTTSTPTSTPPGTPTTDQTDCNKMCIDLKQGFSHGHPISPNEECSSKGKCASAQVINSCCCIPCKDKDTECFCKAGTSTQKACSAAQDIGYCCLFATKSRDPRVPDPPLEFTDPWPYGDNVCGYTETDFKTKECTKIHLNICPKIACDLCTTLIHEMFHWYLCFINKIATGSPCDGFIEHVLVAYYTYQDCMQNSSECNLDCSEAKDEIPRYCEQLDIAKDVHGDRCPEDDNYKKAYCICNKFCSEVSNSFCSSTDFPDKPDYNCSSRL